MLSVHVLQGMRPNLKALYGSPIAELSKITAAAVVNKIPPVPEVMVPSQLWSLLQI